MFLTNVFTVVLFFIANTSAPEFVEEYHTIASKKEEINFIDKYKDNKSIDIQAYVVSLKMKQAKYKTFPWSKLAVFNREKKNLDKLIKANPKNVHLRYVRLVIQEKTPKILSYNKFIKEDKKFLKFVLKRKDKSDYLDVYILKNTSL